MTIRNLKTTTIRSLRAMIRGQAKRQSRAKRSDDTGPESNDTEPENNDTEPESNDTGPGRATI